MSTQLVEAIRILHLEPGQTYHVEIDGRAVEIRVPPAEEPSQYADQVMLAPWFDMPRNPVGTVQAFSGPHSPLDPPLLPDGSESDA